VSLPPPYVWIPWRCCIWSTWIGRAAHASQEGREQLHCLLPSTCSSTSRRFCCICASSGNPVISDSSSSCFVRKILFCASVATPYPFRMSTQSCPKLPTLSAPLRHCLIASLPCSAITSGSISRSPFCRASCPPAAASFIKPA
jgi:hypothetical protein